MVDNFIEIGILDHSSISINFVIYDIYNPIGMP